MPEEAYESFSLRASSISSCRFFYRHGGFTVMMSACWGEDHRREIGERIVAGVGP